MNPDRIEDLKQRDVTVALSYWNGNDNRWHVDQWLENSVDVTNVGDWNGLRHTNVALSDIVVVTASPTAEEAAAMEAKEEAEFRSAAFAKKAKPVDAGCWVDGHWGQYGGAQVIEIARDRGWEDAEAIDLAARHLASMGPSTEPGLTVDEHEMLTSAADDAEEWLNEHVAPEGYAFGWHDGEFFLWSHETWEEQ